ncbi:exo-polygalacturonase [Thozetella sp. PMI_491]|nr:exo-polygalacturonase [Thozetella sp. PMI_491]
MRYTLSLGLLALAAGFQGVASELTKCIVPSQYKCSNGKASDSPAISDTFARCSKDSEIIFSAGVEYNVFSPIKQSNFSNVVIRQLGNLNLPQNITYVQGIVAAAGGSLTWFDVKGTDLSWIGTSNVTTGWFKSYGQAWYDANPSNASGLPNRPHLLRFTAQNGYARYWKSSKPIGANFALAGNNITVRDTIVDAYSNSSGFPFNTDGIGIGGTEILIEDSVIYNGDDAFAVGSGAHNAIIRRATIGYSTHGMSIGSLGSNPASFANVSNILFDDVTVIDGLYAARFKSWSGGQGLAQNITWNNIRVFNVSYPIFVTQVYYNQATTGPPTGPVTQAVNMQDFTWSNFKGTINSYQSGDLSCVSDPCWYDIGLPTNLNHTEALIIQCATGTSCKNFKVQNAQLYTQSGEPSTDICVNVGGALNPDFGLTCANSTSAIPYVPTIAWDSDY